MFACLSDTSHSLLPGFSPGAWELRVEATPYRPVVLLQGTSGHAGRKETPLEYLLGLQQSAPIEYPAICLDSVWEYNGHLKIASYSWCVPWDAFFAIRMFLILLLVLDIAL